MPTETRTVREWHALAMAAADEADAACRRGEDARTHRILAADCECMALQVLARSPQCDAEPTRSVLHRSAAHLLLAAGLPALANGIARVGLRDTTPEPIASELRTAIEYATAALEAHHGR